MSQHPERSPAWNLGPQSAREEDMNNYSVYCLYTKIAGLFSIEYGKAAHHERTSWVSGTASEWKKQRTKTLNTSMKWRYIRACEARSIPIYREVVYSCETKQRAEELKYALIQMYPGVLCNVRGVRREHVMKELPAFLRQGENSFPASRPGFQRKRGQKAIGRRMVGDGEKKTAS